MNQPLLRFIVTKNYKNLSLEQIVRLKNLNIFIGSNGSGKSNFISCLKFLKDSLTKIPDESRAVSSFEDAVAQIGGNRILDVSVESPARVRLAYCFSFSQNSQTNIPARDSGILDLKIFVNRDNARGVNIAEECLYSGDILHDSTPSTPFYYYKFHDREFGKGAVSIYDEPGQFSTTHFEALDNILTNFLGLTAIPRLLKNS